MFLKKIRRPHAFLLGLLLAGVSVPPSYAVENVRREVHHFFECLGMMLRAPADHKANCQPNRVPGPFGSIQSMSGNDAPPAPVVVPPPPPPPVVVVVAPPEPPTAPDPCPCGSCYAT